MWAGHQHRSPFTRGSSKPDLRPSVVAVTVHGIHGSVPFTFAITESSMTQQGHSPGQDPKSSKSKTGRSGARRTPRGSGGMRNRRRRWQGMRRGLMMYFGSYGAGEFGFEVSNPGVILPEWELVSDFKRWMERTKERVKDPRFVASAAGALALLAGFLVLGFSSWPVSRAAGEVGNRISGFRWLQATVAVLVADVTTSDASDASSIQTWKAATLAHRLNPKASARFLAAVARQPGKLDEVTAQLVSARAHAVLKGELGPEAGQPWAARALWAAGRFDEIPGAWAVGEASEGEAARLGVEAALEAGHPELVPGLWNRLPAGMREDPLAQECHQAWEAGWGEPPGGAGLRKVREWVRQKEEEEEETARRAHWAILAAKGAGDVRLAEAGLRSLLRIKRDQPRDHVAYWRALDSGGRSEEARNLAAAYGMVAAATSSSQEVVAAWTRLRMPELSMEFLLRFRDTARSSLPLAVTITRSLVEAGRWADLNLWSSALRGSGGFRESNAYADFLEFVALNGMALDEGHGSAEARRELAEQRYRRVIDGMPKDARMAEDMACTFDLLGYEAFGARARDLSRKMEPGTLEEWRKLALVARGAGMEDLMLAAALRMYELGGGDTMSRLYVMEALAEGVRVRDGIQPKTLERESGREALVIEEFHRAVVLAAMGRKSEARTLLKGLPSEGLGPRERTWRHVALVESASPTEPTSTVRAWVQAIEPGWLGKKRRAWLAGLLAVPETKASSPKDGSPR